MSGSYKPYYAEAVMTPKQVLLVEDSRDDSTLMLTMARDFNVEFVLSRNYQEACQVLQGCPEGKSKFSLVILDLNLNSQPTGEDLYYKMKADCALIPVLVLSGYFTMDQQKSMSAKGFVMFSFKPAAFTSKFFEEMFLAFNIQRKRLVSENEVAI